MASAESWKDSLKLEVIWFEILWLCLPVYVFGVEIWRGQDPLMSTKLNVLSFVNANVVSCSCVCI